MAARRPIIEAEDLTIVALIAACVLLMIFKVDGAVRGLFLGFAGYKLGMKSRGGRQKG